MHNYSRLSHFLNMLNTDDKTAREYASASLFFGYVSGLEALAQQPGFLRLQKKIHLVAKLNLCDFKGLWSSQSETLVNEIYTISVNWCSYI